MMSPTLSLPGKSLQFKKIGDHSPATLLLIGIGSLLLALGMFWVVNNMARSIYADHRLGSQPHHILENAHVEGECRTRLLILSSCEGTIRDGGKTWKKEFMFFDFSFSDLTVEAIASDADPDLVTLDIAAEKTLNRSLFAALIAAVAAFACFAGLSGLRLAARHHALLAAINRSDAQPWRLVETEVEMPDANSMKIPASADSNPGKVHVTFNKTDAWVSRLTDKTARILAVAPRTGGIPIPIDMAFECFKDLTDDEKNKLRQIVNQHVNAHTTTNTSTHADTFGTTL